MDLPFNLETVGQYCRICLQKGDVNIWNFKVKFTKDEIHYFKSEFLHNTSNDNSEANLSEERSILPIELLQIFNKTTDSLVLPDEFPLLCWQCLEDFRLCYIFHEKVNNSNVKLLKIYDKCLSQCIEEEHFLDVIEEDPLTTTTCTNDMQHEMLKIEDMEQQQIHISNATNIPLVSPEILPRTTMPENQPPPSLRTLDKNSSIVVTQYVPLTMIEPPVKLLYSAEEDEEFLPPRNLHTVDCTTVQINDINQLETLDKSSLTIDNENSNTASPPVCVCQYCPQAFAKFEFLKTHIQKNHVCKFCLKTFKDYLELCAHLKEHKEYKCVICQRLLSSQTNLRHHIKNIHRINLPPKMTLLGFVQTTGDENQQQDKSDAIVESLPEMQTNDTDNGKEAKGDDFQQGFLHDIIYQSKDAEILIDNDIMDMN